MDVEKCSKCKEEHPTNEMSNYAKREAKDGTLKKYYHCRKCNTERAKKYRNTKHGRERINAAVAASIRRDPRKQRARAKLLYHVSKGNIEKPTACERCDEEKRIHGHHEDYSKPLEVMWLCRGCHTDRHRELRQAGVQL